MYEKSRIRALADKLQSVVDELKAIETQLKSEDTHKAAVLEILAAEMPEVHARLLLRLREAGLL